MGISNSHNLARPVGEAAKPFGVRISLRRGDPFRKLLGDDWNRTHWYCTAQERDTAMSEMARRHEYSRTGDAPALQYDKVENVAARGVRHA
jgi:hypothetical protein